MSGRQSISKTEEKYYLVKVKQPIGSNRKTIVNPKDINIEVKNNIKADDIINVINKAKISNVEKIATSILPSTPGGPPSGKKTPKTNKLFGLQKVNLSTIINEDRLSNKNFLNQFLNGNVSDWYLSKIKGASVNKKILEFKIALASQSNRKYTIYKDNSGNIHIIKIENDFLKIENEFLKKPLTNKLFDSPNFIKIFGEYNEEKNISKKISRLQTLLRTNTRFKNYNVKNNQIVYKDPENNVRKVNNIKVNNIKFNNKSEIESILRMIGINNANMNKTLQLLNKSSNKSKIFREIMNKSSTYTINKNGIISMIKPIEIKNNWSNVEQIYNKVKGNKNKIVLFGKELDLKISKLSANDASSLLEKINFSNFHLDIIYKISTLLFRQSAMNMIELISNKKIPINVKIPIITDYISNEKEVIPYRAGVQLGQMLQVSNQYKYTTYKYR